MSIPSKRDALAEAAYRADNPYVAELAAKNPGRVDAWEGWLQREGDSRYHRIADALMPLVDVWLTKERAAITQRVETALAEFDHDQYQPPCSDLAPDDRCLVCKVRAAMNDSATSRRPEGN